MNFDKDFVFGNAKEEDLGAILWMYRSAIGTPGSTWTMEYPNEDYLRGDFERGDLFCLKNSAGQVIGAISADDDELVKGLNCWSEALSPGIELSRLVVHENYRNQGIARCLLVSMMEVARKRGFKSIHFLVSKYNELALRSYNKLDFDNVGECDLYEGEWWCYEKGLDGLDADLARGTS